TAVHVFNVQGHRRRMVLSCLGALSEVHGQPGKPLPENASVTATTTEKAMSSPAKQEYFLTINKSETEELHNNGTVTLRRAIQPSNCTVLGYNVTSKSELWKELDWAAV